jgi:E3 ubiquitin-protein ligase RNF5
MDNNMMEEIIYLDLNQEPLDEPHGSELRLDTIVNELATAHERIEERIRQLEAVTARARHRQRWRQDQAPPQTDSSAEAMVQHASRLHNTDDGNTAQERRVGSGKTSKTGSLFLIAQALGMDTDAKKAGSGSGGLFDCNICLEMARDPILTCCGHLFCWPCFYQLSYVDSHAKECPECGGEVTDTSIIPVYGNGSGDSTPKSELKEIGLKVPPRPHAHRVESLRQQFRGRGISSSVEERIHSIVGIMGERLQAQDLDRPRVMGERTNFSVNRYQTSRVLPSTETESSQWHRSLQVSRLLLQEAASFSSLSSALYTAERLVVELEAYIHGYHTTGGHEQAPSVDNRDSFSSIYAVIQPEIQSPDTAAEINSIVSPSFSSFRTDIDAPAVNLENQTMDNAIEINLTTSPSSSRTRTDVPRVSDLENGVSHEARRRRLR